MTVSGLTLTGRMFGYIRDVVVALTFGAGISADVFIVAMRVPILFRRTFGDGAINAAFMPMYAERQKDQTAYPASRFAGEVLSTMTIAATAVTFVGVLAMPDLLLLLAPGFIGDQSKFDLTVTSARIALPSILFLTASALYAALLNYERRYYLTAFAPVVFNLTVTAVLLSVPFFGLSLELASAGILAGAIAQFAWIALVALFLGQAVGFAKPLRSEESKIFLRRLIPILAIWGMPHILSLVAMGLASTIPGGVSYLYYAERVFSLPVGAVSAALGVILLPELARSQSPEQRDDWHSVLGQYCGIALALTLPAATGLIILSEPIIELLFQRGAFLESDTAATAMTLSGFAVGIPAVALGRILNTALFAAQNTTTPLAISGLRLLLTVGLSLLLAPLMGVAGISLSMSISSWITLAILFVLLYRSGRLKIGREFRRLALQVFLGTLAMGAYLLILRQLPLPLNGGIIPEVVVLTAIILSGGGVFLVCSGLGRRFLRSGILPRARS